MCPGNLQCHHSHGSATIVMIFIGTLLPLDRARLAASTLFQCLCKAKLRLDIAGCSVINAVQSGTDHLKR